MSKIVCSWCDRLKDAHTQFGWETCQSKSSQHSSSKEMPGGVR